MKRGFVSPHNRKSLYLFAIKMWGQQYVDNDFYVFLWAVLKLVEVNSQDKHDKETLNIVINKNEKN